MLDPDGDGNAVSELAKSYTIGHDVFLETVAGNQLRHLLIDGHGSTRQLVDAFGNVIQHGQTPQIFAYNPHGFTLAQALTTHLYSGEQTDALTGLQYLRARYYNPATGTFNRLDPFAGNMQDPQSLHKYLYTHGDPANAVDPTGMFIGGLSVALISTSLRTAQNFGYAALMTTGVYAAIGALGGAGTYAFAGENPLVGAYNGALIAGGLRMAYMIKGSKGVWNAVLDGAADGTSRFLTEMIFAHRPGNNDHRTNGQILRAAILKGIDSYASKVWSSATSLIGKPSWLKWADSPLGKGFMSAFDASITSVWGDVQKVPRPDNDIIVENAVLAAILSGASTGFKGALKAQFPDIPDKYSDDILRATLTMSLNVFVGFDAKGIAEFARFWGGW
jgi:RHS repeat-associated protein